MTIPGKFITFEGPEGGGGGRGRRGRGRERARGGEGVYLARLVNEEETGKVFLNFFFCFFKNFTHKKKTLCPLEIKSPLPQLVFFFPLCFRPS